MRFLPLVRSICMQKEADSTSLRRLTMSVTCANIPLTVINRIIFSSNPHTRVTQPSKDVIVLSGSLCPFPPLLVQRNRISVFSRTAVNAKRTFTAEKKIQPFSDEYAA